MPFPKMTEFCHFSYFSCLSERNYNLQSLWITLYSGPPLAQILISNPRYILWLGTNALLTSQTKCHKQSLHFTSLTILTSLTFNTRIENFNFQKTFITSFLSSPDYLTFIIRKLLSLDNVIFIISLTERNPLFLDEFPLQVKKYDVSPN